MSTKYVTREEQKTKTELAEAKTEAWNSLLEKADLSDVMGMLADDLQVRYDNAEEKDIASAKIIHEAQDLLKQARGLLRLVEL
ncbi:MAG TPA: hypothetical protein VIE65_12355 [Methylobacter sp.]|jgi:ketosteroid isomerase-like protein